MAAAAKQNDKVVGTDTHIVMVATPGGPVPTSTQLPFSGTISGNCSTDVYVNGQPAAIVGSTADNKPPHLPVPSNGTFQTPPTNKGTVVKGSGTVLVNGKPAARTGDKVNTCNDPSPAPTSSIVATSTVDIGD